MSDTTDQLIDTLAKRAKASGVSIIPEVNTRRLEELEAKLPMRLPQSFRSLLSRYSFPRFDAGGITFFAWSEKIDEYTAEAMAAEGSLSELLLPAGFVQIGRPDTGIFDAVCFDLNDRKQNPECRVVLIDHEEILCNWRVKVMRELWQSFRRLAETADVDRVLAPDP